jgi:hypothetical protein
MVNKNKPLHQTNAGKELESELAKERERFEKQLRELETQMREAQLERDAESEKALSEMREENAANMRRIERERQELQVSMQRLLEEKYAKLEGQLKAQQEAQDRATEEQNRQLEILRQERSRVTALPAVPTTAVSPRPRNRANEGISLSVSGSKYFLHGAAYRCW